MEKFVPYEKLSKKEKRKLDQAKRQTWGELNPVTRKPENSKVYNRNKARNWKSEMHEISSGSFLFEQGTTSPPAGQRAGWHSGRSLFQLLRMASP